MTRMQSPVTQPPQPTEDEIRARFRAAVAAHGPTGAARLAKCVSKYQALALAGPGPVTPGTLALGAMGMASLPEVT